MMYYLIDILLAFVCLFFAAVAAKKGFIKAMLDIVFSILASVGAWYLAAALCDDIYRLFLREKMIGYISDNVMEGLSSSVDSLASSVPQWIVDTAVNAGIIRDPTTISAELSSTATAASIEQAFIGPIAVYVVKAALFVLLAFLFGVILRIISHFIGKAVRRSAVRTPDIILGAVFGILKGLVVSLIVALFLYFLAFMIPGSDFTKYIDHSYFCKYAVLLLNIK